MNYKNIIGIIREAKISACLVIRNEAKTIDRCLSSLQGVVDEIIVVHDGDCEDDSLNICRRHGAKIFVRPFFGAMEGHLPFAYRQCVGDWVLRVDGDEYLSPELKENLKNLTSNQDVSAYEFFWPLWDGTKTVTRNWPYKLCFFRKDKISFLGVVHFVTEVHGKISRSDLTLGHEPLVNNYTWKNFKKRWRQLAKIQAETYFKNISHVESFNYSKQDWSKKILLRRSLSLLIAPFDFLIIIFKTLKEGAYRNGIFAYKLALMSGAYRVVVDYYIFKRKYWF